MRHASVLLFWVSFSAFAQTAETTIFRAVLLPASEVPAVNNLNARGMADVMVGVTRDASGQIASGTVDVLARVTFPAAATGVGLGVWNGNTGQNGPLMFNTPLSAQTPYAIQPNGDSIHLAAQVTADNPAAVTALRNLLANPSQFYVNVLTSANPNGAMRGQLQRAQKIVLMALLSSDNVVPPVYPPGYGAALVVAIGTRDASGNWTSGEIYCSTTFSTQDPTTFTAFQIHGAPTGANGTAVFSAPLPTGLLPPPSGNGSLGPYYIEIGATTPAQTAAFTNLFTNPGALYIDLHTTGSPNGSLRGQLHATDTMPFPMLLASANESQTTSVKASAPATLTLSSLRREDGSIAAGAFLADMDYRFPSAMQSFGLYLHPGAVGQVGPPAIQAAPDFHSDSGFGNFFGWSLPFADPVSLSTLNDLVVNPSLYYADLHTMADPGGGARAQLALPPAANSSVTAVVSADLDPNAVTLAPGGLITIYGSNLAQVATDLSGWSGQTLPFALNGARVLIGGHPAPLLYVSPVQINAQVPVELAQSGAQVLVSGPAGGIASMSASAAPNAPAIFYYPSAAILKNADFSLVSAANPAKPGDVILVYATGLGRTDPPLATGQAPTGADVIANTAAVAATIGGKAATVIYSIASPSFPGLYQVAVTVPAGLSGPSPLVIQQGAVSSNTVTLALK
jgi:uncharacterized protein (TIGR03437 family)